MNWIAGGTVAAIALPALAIGLGMPSWIAGLVSATAGGGVVFLLSPRKLFERLDASGAAQGKIEFARDLLTEAEPYAVRLEIAVNSIGTVAISERVRHLAKISREIFVAIENDPLRIDRVRRFLTYYLPRAADIAEAYAVLEKSGKSETTRSASTGEMIDRHDDAFTHYAANLY